MVSSAATSVTQYLEELPPERRKVVAAVRAVVRKHLPKGYAESMNWGMIAYEIPLARYPETYNKQPLAYVALAAQKNNYALYLSGPYMDPEVDAMLREAFKSAGKKLDMGKSCLRFKSLDDIPLDVIGKVVAAVPVDRYIEHYENSRRAGRK